MTHPVRIAFLGDVSLNDEYRDLARAGVDLFGAVAPILRSHDLVVGNLEAVCEGEDGELWTKKPRLRTDPETLERLRDLHLGVATLAHNHVYDHLASGFRRTTACLERLGISYLGAGWSETTAREPIRRELGGQTFVLLDYVARDTNPKLPADAELCLNYFEVDRAIREVRAARETADWVVVLLHWGGRSEEADFPHPGQREEARQLAAAGADLIVGHHPHTLQPEERFGTTRVFYSLGNFCFADVVCDGKVWEIDRDRNACSVILSVTFGADGLTVESIPIRNREHRIVPDDCFWPRIERSRRLFPFFRHRATYRLHSLRVRYLDRVRFYFWGNGRSFWVQLRRLDLGKISRFLRNS